MKGGSRLVFWLSVFLCVTQAAWVGENFWSTVYPSGQVEDGRSPDDFLHFKVLRDTPIEAFIGFWIKKDENHHESFGHVFLDRDRVCGQFLSPDQNGTERICGEFRVLSVDKDDFSSPFYFISSKVAQAFDSVGYRRKQIARIWVDDERSASVFGGVSLSERRAYGIFQNGTTINIDYATNPEDYAKRVEVLHIQRSAIEKIKETRRLNKEARALREKRKQSGGRKTNPRRKTVKRRHRKHDFKS